MSNVQRALLASPGRFDAVCLYGRTNASITPTDIRRAAAQLIAFFDKPEALSERERERPSCSAARQVAPGRHVPRRQTCLRAQPHTKLRRPASTSSPAPANPSRTTTASRRRGAAICLTRQSRDEPPCGARAGTARARPTTTQRASRPDDSPTSRQLGSFPPVAQRGVAPCVAGRSPEGRR